MTKGVFDDTVNLVKASLGNTNLDGISLREGVIP